MKKIFRLLTTFCLSALLAGMAAVTVTADSGVPTALSAKQLEDLPAALRPVSIGAQSPDLLYDLRVREYRDFGEEQVEYQYTELYHTQKVYQTVNDIGADYRKNVYGDAEGNRCEWDEKGRISSFQCAPEVKLFAQNSDLSAVKAYAEERPARGHGSLPIGTDWMSTPFTLQTGGSWGLRGALMRRRPRRSRKRSFRKWQMLIWRRKKTLAFPFGLRISRSMERCLPFMMQSFKAPAAEPTASGSPLAFPSEQEHSL